MEDIDEAAASFDMAIIHGHIDIKDACALPKQGTRNKQN
jgi:hypothetical protein